MCITSSLKEWIIVLEDLKPLDFLISLPVSGLATYRIARLLSTESGPWQVMKRVRDRLDGITTAIQCLHCVGLYVAVFVALASLAGPLPLQFAVFTLAVAGFVSLTQDILFH